MNISNKLSEKTRVLQEVDFSCILVVYKSKSGLWRGFAVPYDVTYEAETKHGVITVLKDMVNAYRDGLVRHNFPKHLSNLPLSDEEDREYLNTISLESIIKNKKIETPNLYVATATFA